MLAEELWSVRVWTRNIRGCPGVSGTGIWYWECLVLISGGGLCGRGLPPPDAIRSHQIAVCGVWRPSEHLRLSAVSFEPPCWGERRLLDRRWGCSWSANIFIGAEMHYELWPWWTGLQKKTFLCPDHKIRHQKFVNRHVNQSNSCTSIRIWVKTFWLPLVYLKRCKLNALSGSYITVLWPWQKEKCKMSTVELQAFCRTTGMKSLLKQMDDSSSVVCILEIKPSFWSLADILLRYGQIFHAELQPATRTC